MDFCQSIQQILTCDSKFNLRRFLRSSDEDDEDEEDEEEEESELFDLARGI